jgi:hypothetical protein
MTRSSAWLTKTLIFHTTKIHSRHKLASLAPPCQAAPESGIRPIAVDLYGARHVRCGPKRELKGSFD